MSACRVEGRRVAGRASVALPALSPRAAVRRPWVRFLPPALRTRRADFRHRSHLDVAALDGVWLPLPSVPVIGGLGEQMEPKVR